MSARNGDKARYGRQRKTKLAKRQRMRAMAAKPAFQKHEHAGGVLGTAAERIGSALGTVAATAKRLRRGEG